MISAEQFRLEIVRPTLDRMGMWSAAAENLLVGTAIQESGLRYLRQVPSGPALGVYQVEPATMHDLLRRYLDLRPDVQARFESALRTFTPADVDWNTVDDSVLAFRLISDLAFATAVARLRYWIDPEPLPAANDIPGLARTWKRVFNTVHGAGRVEDFMENYERCAA